MKFLMCVLFLGISPLAIPFTAYAQSATAAVCSNGTTIGSHWYEIDGFTVYSCSCYKGGQGVAIIGCTPADFFQYN